MSNLVLIVGMAMVVFLYYVFNNTVKMLGRTDSRSEIGYNSTGNMQNILDNKQYISNNTEYTSESVNENPQISKYIAASVNVKPQISDKS